MIGSKAVKYLGIISIKIAYTALYTTVYVRSVNTNTIKESIWNLTLNKDLDTTAGNIKAKIMLQVNCSF